jgi:2-methylcitrate dehydratase PrpD
MIREELKMSNKKIAESIAEMSVGLKYEDLPSYATDYAKKLVMDVLGSMIGTRDLLSSRVVTEMVQEMGGMEECTVVGWPKKVPAMNAAFANAVQCYGFDYIDDHNESNAHPSAATIPTSMAMAEALKRNGKDLIVAIALGNEVVCRVGSAFLGQMYYQCFHPTSTCGTFGAAISASKLMKLNRQQTIYSQGIAGSMVAGLMAWNSEGSFTKRLQAGHPAMSGIIAAKMAQKGFNGPSDIYEGKEAFLNAYSFNRQWDTKYITEGLGKEWVFATSSIKAYPCCRYSGGHIDACLEIVSKYKPDPNKIKKVLIRSSKYTMVLLTDPKENKWNPKTVVDGQFSMPYQAAIAFVRGKVGIDEFTEVSLNNRQARELMKKVEVVLDPEFERRYPEQYSSSVTITMDDGHEYTAVVDNPRGDKRNPITYDEMKEKFKDLVIRVYKDEKHAEKVIDCIHDLEKMKDVGQLMNLVNVAVKV